MRGNGFQGQKLRIARRLNAWSKADLAEQLQVSTQFIHTLEIDQRAPSPDMVAALSLLLKVQPSFFYEALPSEVREDECHFRGRQPLSDRIAQQIISRGTALEIIIRFLDAHLDLPEVFFPSIEINNDEDIEAAAESCRQQWRLGDEPVPNMCRLLEAAGAVVTLVDSDAHEIDALSMARIRPLVFRDAASNCVARQRFNLAHECGHLVMHQGISTGDEITEAQADHFAAAFLMPRAQFAREFPVGLTRLDWPTIYALKLRWGVKARAVIERGHCLGLLDELRYAGAKRFLSQSGQAGAERYDDKLERETPQLLKTAIAAYLEVANCTLGAFARQVGMTPAMIEQLLAETALRGSYVKLLRNTAI